LGFNENRMMRHHTLETTRFRVPESSGQMRLFGED
jgi:hypothetical protein